MKTFKYKFLDFALDAYLKCGYYTNGRIAIQVIAADSDYNKACDIEPGDQIVTVTTNLPDKPLAPGQVFVKTWSENEDMLMTLPPGLLVPVGFAPTGFVEATIAVLDKNVLKQYLREGSK